MPHANNRISSRFSSKANAVAHKLILGSLTKNTSAHAELIRLLPTIWSWSLESFKKQDFRSYQGMGRAVKVTFFWGDIIHASFANLRRKQELIYLTDGTDVSAWQ